MPRLEIKNYYFLSFDWRTGPEKPEDFYEDFRVDVGDVGSNAVTNYSFFVCTPSGLHLVMKELKSEYLMKRNLVIVPRFNMELVLRAINEHIGELDRYGLDVT